MKKLLITLISLASQVQASVDVRDYGATGDGVTNDTAAVAAALVACPAGDTVIFPAGNYECAITLVNNKHLHLESGAKLKWGGAGNPGVLNDIAAVVNCRVTGRGEIYGTATAGIVLLRASTLAISLARIGGLNGSFYTGSPCVVDADVTLPTSGLGLDGPATVRWRGDWTSHISLRHAGAKMSLWGNVANGGPSVNVFAGDLQMWGNCVGTESDAIHVRGANASAVLYGNAISALDCGAYLSSGSLTVFGNVVSNGWNFNLCGRGNGIAAATGKMRIHGDVSGPIGAVVGDADVIVYGDVLSNRATGFYHEQNPQLDVMFNFPEYRPLNGDLHQGVSVVRVRNGSLRVFGQIGEQP